MTAKKDAGAGKFQARIQKFPKEVQNLIQKGKEQKFITEQELMKVVPNIEENLILLDELYELFLDLDVEVIDVREEKKSLRNIPTWKCRKFVGKI